MKYYPSVWEPFFGDNVYRQRDLLRQLSNDLIDHCGELLTQIEEAAQ